MPRTIIKLKLEIWNMTLPTTDDVDFVTERPKLLKFFHDSMGWSLSCWDKSRLIYRNFQSARAPSSLVTWCENRLKNSNLFSIDHEFWSFTIDRYIKGIFTVILIWTFIKIGYVIIQMWVTAPQLQGLQRFIKFLLAIDKLKFIFMSF